VGVPSVTTNGGTGYLSSKFGPFEIGVDPAQKEFRVRDVSLPKGMAEEQFTRRKTARQAVEDHFKSIEADPTAFDTMDAFYQRAYKLVSSPEAQKAFTLDGETDATEKLYGTDLKDRNGQQSGIARRLMLARRLVEAGVRFVSVSYGGWDLHAQVKDGVSRQLPQFDHALSGLILDLESRGLLDSTMVMVVSEFGRSPKINTDSGRDHYARCFSIAAAGGGLAKGTIYGSSNATASEPDVDPVTVEDYLFTVYNQLGINADDRLMAPGDRPIDIIRGGKLVKGLIA
jgi:arylsulfatase A-like enzyme